MARRLTISAALLLLSMPVGAATVRGRAHFRDVPLPGATVTLRFADKTITRVTGVSGEFSFEEVPVSHGTIVAELAGLKTVKKNFRITESGADVQVALQLKLARTSEPITIGCDRQRYENGSTFTMGAIRSE